MDKQRLLVLVFEPGGTKIAKTKASVKAKKTKVSGQAKKAEANAQAAKTKAQDTEAEPTDVIGDSAEVKPREDGEEGDADLGGLVIDKDTFAHLLTRIKVLEDKVAEKVGDKVTKP